MSTKIEFDYGKMEEAAKVIDKCAENYTTAATTLLNALDASTASWEGASKVKFMNLVNGSVKEYICTTVPKMVQGLAELLRNNENVMQNADDEIAKNIPDSI